MNQMLSAVEVVLVGLAKEARGFFSHVIALGEPVLTVHDEVGPKALNGTTQGVKPFEVIRFGQ